MIKLEDKRTALINLPVTIKALEELDALMDYYSGETQGPAYLKIRHALGDLEIQIDRHLFAATLKAQRQRLADYLATLGIEA